MPKTYVSIGSNVERDLHVPQALRELEERFGPLDTSSVYETAAVGFDGDPFYNLVVGFNTDEPVEMVAAALHELEQRHSRSRHAKKFAPRTLDLDLILYGDLVHRDAKPFVPRDEITRYAFMLEPLAEIAPDLVGPLGGRTYGELWAVFDKTSLNQRRIKPAWQHR